MPLSLCELPQLAAPCNTGTQTGWCYVTGTNLPPGCASMITVSTGSASLAIVGCY